jgi:hypothetical protein
MQQHTKPAGPCPEVVFNTVVVIVSACSSKPNPQALATLQFFCRPLSVTFVKSVELATSTLAGEATQAMTSI